MLKSEAFPVVFFMLSFYVFAIALLYVLSRAWQKALSTRTYTDRTSAPSSDRSNYAHHVSALPCRTPNDTTNLSSRRCN
jgi:hypothetical protein